MQSNNVRRCLWSVFLLTQLIATAIADSGQPVWRQFTPSVGHWQQAGEMNTARATARVIKLSGGEVLAIGGQDFSYPVNIESTEIYNPYSDSWRYSGSLNVARNGFTATKLKDGSVLAAGGYVWTPNGFIFFDSTERYDPESETWQLAAPMPSPRVGHTAIRLFNGKILVAGGATGAYSNLEVSASSVLYDPKTDTWSPTGALNLARSSAVAIRLYDGRVLITGGNTANGATSTAEIYDSASGTWQYVQDMGTPLVGHNAVRLRSGQILVTGGSNGHNYFSYSTLFNGCCFDDSIGEGDLNWTSGYKIKSFTEKFDPATNTWIIDSTGGPAYWMQMVLMKNGHVLAAGGCCDSNVLSENDDSGSYIYEEYIDGFSTASAYNPYTRKWSKVDSMPEARHAYNAVRLVTGNVLVFGGASPDGRYRMLSSSLLFVLER